MSDHNYYRMPVAAHLILCRGDDVLMLLRQNTGYKDGFYSLVAGHLDGNERASSAMIREAKEEAGIDIAPEDLRFACVVHRRTDGENERIDFFYSCTKWQGNITNTEPHKCGGLRFYPLKEPPSNTIGYIRAALNAFARGDASLEYGWVAEET